MLVSCQRRNSGRASPLRIEARPPRSVLNTSVGDKLSLTANGFSWLATAVLPRKFVAL
jgi:hypothetical protein